MVAPDFLTTFDGATEGAAVNATSTATGSGSPVSNPSGPGMVIAAAAAIDGAKGVELNATGTAAFIDRAVTVGSGYVGGFMKFKIASGVPTLTANLAFMQFRNSGGAMVTANLGTTRILGISYVSGGATNLNGGAPLPDGNYSLHLTVKKGTTTSDGEVRIVLRKDGVIVDNLTFTNKNTGTTDVALIRRGKTSSTGDVTAWRTDSWAQVEGSPDEIELPSPPVAGGWLLGAIAMG